jgi:hypothetical protein
MMTTPWRIRSFHNKYIISTLQNPWTPGKLACLLSIIKNNGREIFQQERVGEGHQETGNELADGAEDTLNSVLMNGMARKRGRSPWVLNHSGMMGGVTWKPTQVFEKSESRGRHLQRMLPFCFFGCDRYSARKVSAGSIPATRRVGTMAATRVTAERIRTTVTIVRRS